MDNRSPTKAFISVDFPTLGLPIIFTYPAFMLHIRECIVCVLILLSVQDFAPNQTCIAPIVVAFLDKIQRILLAKITLCIGLAVTILHLMLSVPSLKPDRTLQITYFIDVFLMSLSNCLRS